MENMYHLSDDASFAQSHTMTMITVMLPAKRRNHVAFAVGALYSCVLIAVGGYDAGASQSLLTRRMDQQASQSCSVGVQATSVLTKVTLLMQWRQPDFS